LALTLPSGAPLVRFAVILPVRFYICAGGHPSIYAVVTLLSSPRWVLLLVLALVAGMGMMSINSYLFSYLNELHVKEGLMGVASMLPTVLEIPVFFFGGRLLKRFKPYTLLVTAVALLGIRLLLYYLLDFPAGVLGFQLLNGLVFPVMWIAFLTPMLRPS
jgi:hypothetical protein